eukprot:g37640.t1
MHKKLEEMQRELKQKLAQKQKLEQKQKEIGASEESGKKKNREQAQGQKDEGVLEKRRTIRRGKVGMSEDGQRQGSKQRARKMREC